MTTSIGIPTIWNDSDIWNDSQIWNDYTGFPSPSGSGMYKLLPTGEAWPLEQESSVLKDFIYGLGLSLDRMNIAAKSNLDIIIPGDTGIFLQDWERILGLPKCPDIEMTLQQRADSVLAMWNITPYSNAEFFVKLADVFGYEITATNGTRGAVRDVFKITIGVPALSSAPIYFKAGASSAGDRLIEYDFGPVECLIRFFKPAHTYIIFEFA
jgi:uncharacterized protein YmfQ (DUF2313 family)